MRLIDADYAQKQLTIAEVNAGKNFDTDCDHVRDFLNALPTIDVASVVHGKWNSCFEDWRQQIEGDECSICGFSIYGGVNNFNYCPNCGARMDEEETNEGI